VRYLMNGHLFYKDDDPSPTSPWLGLFTRIERKAAWRNISLQGSPVILREVRLSHADRLEGWISSFYGETQPARRTTQSTDEDGNVIPLPAAARAGAASKAAPRPPVNPDDFDWAAKDGEILGRRLVTALTPARSSPAVSLGELDSSAA